MTDGPGRGEEFSGCIGSRGGSQREKKKGSSVKEIGPLGLTGVQWG